MASSTSGDGSATNEIDALYDEYNLDHGYDDPNNCPNKRYPPDDEWRKRKQALLTYYDNGCGRCGAPLGPHEPFECHLHHIIPLSENGSNHLSNLVPLCEYCHALMHPDNDSVEADWRNARLFPDEDADWRVAVEREPQTDFERAVYEDRSRPDDRAHDARVNTYAQSWATTSTPARLAVTKENPTDADKTRLSVDGSFEMFCQECRTPVAAEMQRCQGCQAASDDTQRSSLWYAISGLLALTFGAVLPFVSGPVVYYCGYQLGEEYPGSLYRILGGFYTVIGLGLFALLGALFLPLF